MFKLDLRHSFAILLSTTLTLSANAATDHPFSVQDLVRLKRLSEPALSPDERYIVFTLRETDIDADRGRTDLWLLDLQQPSAQPQRLTSHPENDGSAQWSRDSRAIYFLSSRSGSQQVWRLSVGGGEAQPVTDLPLDVGTFKLAPNDSLLAVTLEVFPDCAKETDVPTCTVKRSKQNAERKARGMVFDRVFIRHWDTWDDGTQAHLFVLPVRDGKATGAPRDLSASLDADVPSKPFGDASEYAFTPDSKHVVFSTRIKGKSEPWSTNFDLYVAATDGGAPLTNLTVDNLAWDTQPIFSGDGRWLAWRAMERPGFEADRFHIVLMDRNTGVRRALTKTWDSTVNAMSFAPDGKSIYALTDHFGQQALWSVDIKTGQPTLWVDKGHVDGIAAGRKAVYFSSANLNSPADLYAVAPRGAPRRLTQVNAEALSATRMGAAEQFTFVGANGDTVYAHIVTPADFDANKKYPVAFFVHGGPQSSYGNAWSYRWNPQTYAGAGYAFIAIDFHGSPGYGQAFTDSISGDWGGKPLEDLQKGLAAALAKYSWLDANRICALGASYGGYMMNWIAGNWQSPFKCIVNHAGVFDSRMMSYATEELWFDEWEHGGTQYSAPQNYEKHNPVNRVKEWRVPMLFIAGQKDFRIPYTQSVAAFTAMQRRGLTSRLLIFPNENHWVLKPSNSVQWHEEVGRWLKEYLTP